ncbi:TPM domain-containing protein [Acinetobacter rudis]|uniref:TPM domain-containing protein n=1 Tax=Acinetobacter rudis CIP 110305 TaxID=421052 RepID=S3MR96_9GAMM|nr:TPM domain-containing protein [Acinetobacter rudis]EPF70405.1 hypothetical protein F945_03428 [Acinetobacter rudis CIP 110305]
MVNQSSNTVFVSKHVDTAPSFKRWIKHACSIVQVKHYFNQKDQQAIAAAVQQAEQGHAGEIQVVIEGHIPAGLAYHHNSRQRAQQLFAELGVWDTAYNSGVMLYLNLCERAVEIVVDRGIQQAAQATCWEQICQEMLPSLKEKAYLEAVLFAIERIAEILQHFQQELGYTQQDELSNQPIILK